MAFRPGMNQPPPGLRVGSRQAGATVPVQAARPARQRGLRRIPWRGRIHGRSARPLGGTCFCSLWRARRIAAGLAAFGLAQGTLRCCAGSPFARRRVPRTDGGTGGTGGARGMGRAPPASGKRRQCPRHAYGAGMRDVGMSGAAGTSKGDNGGQEPLPVPGGPREVPAQTAGVKAGCRAGRNGGGEGRLGNAAGDLTATRHAECDIPGRRGSRRRSSP